jgi:peptidoglycan hydrolase-like protein with peptidoglycan-binding domain
MRLTTRAREAMRPAIGALAALCVLSTAPAVATAETPQGGSEGGTRASGLAAGWSAGPVAPGAGFHSGPSERVREVQHKLNRLGYGAGALDGLFGPRTEAAVRRFQADSGLETDGAVGPQTLRQLHSRINQKERLLARGSGFKSSHGSERVRDLQRRLNRLGQRAGVVDGLFGSATDAAVRRFQSTRALAVDGVAGPRTLAALGSGTRSVRQPARSEGRHAKSKARAPSRARSNDPLARRAPPQPDFEPLPLPTTAPDQTEGPRWGILLLIAIGVALLLALAMAFRSDRFALGEETDGEPDESGRKHSAGDPLDALSAELTGDPDAAPLFGVGARADLAGSPEVGYVTGTAYVELQLFAESQEGRWETDPLDGGAPFSVAVAQIEDDVRAIVVPDRLPALARALRNAGRDVQPSDLEILPFMLELSPELEAEVVRRAEPAPSKGVL